MMSVGRWVIEEACRQGSALRRQGARLEYVRQISAKQLESDDIVTVVRRAIELNGMDPQRLILELTETALMRDLDATIIRLKALKRLGVRLAIDDFGTGYSSLSYLSQFPIDILKIDRSFVSGVPDDPEAATLIHTLVELGRALGIDTIAEGIETQTQFELTTLDRADYGQGFLFSQPIGGNDLATFVKNWSPQGRRMVPSR